MQFNRFFFVVDGANGLRFSARRKGCFTPGTGSPFSGSFVTSASESLLRVPQAGINPNKAVFTIDSKSSQILIVNNNACELLGYTPRELCDMQFSSLLTNQNKSHVSALAEGQLNSEDGTMVLLSGKVVEMNTKVATKVAVSLWIRQIDAEGRCLAVAEPVERRVAHLLIDRNGSILSGDYEASMLFQMDTPEQLSGLEVQALIPAIQLPDADTSIIAKHIRKQKATGKTVDGNAFPLCLIINMHDSSTGTDTTDSGVSNNSSTSYTITIWVFQNISGLLVIDENGTIESCNHHFSMLMFGYAQPKILGLHITHLVPNFGQEFDYLGYTRSRNVTSSSLDNEESETETDPVYIERDEYLTSSCVASEFLPDADLAKATSEPVNICLEFSSSAAVARPTNMVALKNTHLSKSMSENLLFAENCENNKNIANMNKTIGTLKPSGEVMVFNKDTADNELLTPVNENNSYLCNSLYGTPQNSMSSSIAAPDFMSADISDAIHSMDSSSMAGTAALPKDGTPKFSTQYTDHDHMQHLVTSTPDVRRFSSSSFQPPLIATNSNASHNKPAPALSKLAASLPLLPVQYSDGKYKGEAVHSDENVIDILYTISSQTLPCGRRVFCVWICRDPDIDYDLGDDDDDDGKHQNLTLTFNSINSTVENSLGQAIKNTAAQNYSSRPNSVSLMSQCEDDQVNGEFNKLYTTLKQIGKGAYGYVKMAYRHTDHLLVVTKFILKDKLTPQFMIQTEDKRCIPMEIYLLTTVVHPNIVSVFDVFENEKFFQLVMEKHGSGMDLFEFIDRRPLIDEKLGCYIFRQIANAVEHLHSLNILHRDIKDENIIIDQNFHVKLIDFGSATFMEEGKLFSTFYGTTEYCSPEVLAGNKYAGPELEMWSLGVTLYVLMFFENPFLEIEETLRAELLLPHAVSKPLDGLLHSILDKNPKTRCTMRTLMEHPWIVQDINPAAFNFAWIVPCEAHESNPEKFFTGQVYASTTGLSTASPHDSLSLVDDDDSIIGCDDDECDDDGVYGCGAAGNDDDCEEEEEDEKSLPSQDEQNCDKCGE